MPGYKTLAAQDNGVEYQVKLQQAL